MKDKLYKNNHRGIYYRIKGIFFAFVLLVSSAVVAIIPTYIALTSNVKEATLAETEIEEEKEDTPLDQEEHVSQYLNY